MTLILQLDSHGQPNRWITWQDAAVYHAKDLVAWSLGDVKFAARGGQNRVTGQRSIIELSSIIAIKKQVIGKRGGWPPLLKNRDLFYRDHHVCAYCGGVFNESYLSRDHVLPRSRGGEDTWMNSVTCCLRCNQKKGDRTPEEAGLQLLYVPYVPSRAEHLILANRNILADQMEFLLSFVSRNSRVHKEARPQ